jgi:hypothetical protein
VPRRGANGRNTGTPNKPAEPLTSEGESKVQTLLKETDEKYEQIPQLLTALGQFQTIEKGEKRQEQEQNAGPVDQSITLSRSSIFPSLVAPHQLIDSRRLPRFPACSFHSFFRHFHLLPQVVTHTNSRGRRVLQYRRVKGHRPRYTTPFSR